jgi:hypothetical protein
MTTPEGRVVVGVSRSLAGLQALRYAVAEARRRVAPLVAVRAWYLNGGPCRSTPSRESRCTTSRCRIAGTLYGAPGPVGTYGPPGGGRCAVSKAADDAPP